ncbi:unnamed protein product [Rhizoctonia solani]|uniref:Uncharacterized protein n=1 Tax=Rhizoctonia solani TaxID=456999 RepID=A0A8H2X2I6_9AGAM|nr:unnamed protein product [Rhizoctonia solani]
MMVHIYLAFSLITCVLSTANGYEPTRGQFQEQLRGLETPHRSLHPRQTPIVVAPPSFRTSLPPQSTSLNYWWPYGPNGVNPTTTIPPTSSGVTEMETTDFEDDSSTEATRSTSTTMLSSTTLRTLASSSIKFEETTNGSAGKETGITEPTTSGDDAFNVTALLPLFIILGVLVVVTLAGWTYGRCLGSCRRSGEPAPGGPDIGGKPYEDNGYERDTIGPLRSLGASWVDASRIHSPKLSSGGYYPIREVSMEGESGTTSKNMSNKREGRSWFSRTLSGRKRAINSPSGERGLNAPLVYPTHVRQLPVGGLHARNFGFDSRSSPTHMQSPKTLRAGAASPTVGSSWLSPVSSVRPTPLLSASRHASLRRNIANKIKVDDSSSLVMTNDLADNFRHFDHKRSQSVSLDAEDWSDHKGEAYMRYTAHCASPNTGPKSPMWSPDLEMHHERMRRLRITAEAAHYTIPVSTFSINSPEPRDITHPLQPAPAVLLSPPLQPHLFFTQTNSDDSECDETSESAVAKLRFTRSNPSRNLTRHSNKANVSHHDLFGPYLPLDPTNCRTRKGKARAQGLMESTETLPLSPELRGAAMTKLDEIVKSHWSIRNLAEAPLSPVFYGALTPLLDRHALSEDKSNQTGIEETLLVNH